MCDKERLKLMLQALNDCFNDESNYKKVECIIVNEINLARSVTTLSQNNEQYISSLVKIYKEMENYANEKTEYDEPNLYTFNSLIDSFIDILLLRIYSDL